jgi:arylsulfatase A-like enzyme
MEHGSMEHFYTAYQEVVRVPLILRGPGVPPGRRVDTPVSLVDLVPTVLAMAGVDAQDTDGLDLSPLLGSGDAPGFEGRLLYIEAPGGESHNRATGEFFPFHRAVRKGRYKLILTSSGEAALYDLERDPRELEDISADEQDLVLELLAAAEERYAEAAGDAPESAVELDPDALERLRALGYVP